MSSETSPHSGPGTRARGQAPSVQITKSSPVGKVDKYYLPHKCDQYQKFGYEDCPQPEAFTKAQFLEFLDVKPISCPVFEGEGGKGSFIGLANEVAKSIKGEREHYLFLYLAFLADKWFFTLDFSKLDTLVFKATGNKALPGHIADTKCKPDITAAL
jgi:hypothetical protein